MKRESSRSVPTVGVFLQARLGSTRLAEKVLLPLSGKTVVEHAMMSLRRCHADVYVLLTDFESERRLAPYARQCEYELFAGPSEDVLARYAGALERFRVDRIVRATADNPLVSSELATSLLSLHDRRGADFSGYVGMPLGLGVEIVNAEALRTEQRESRDPYEREHVNPFLYRRPERFSILKPEVPSRYRLPDRSVTLDTSDDYRFLSRLYGDLYEGEPIAIDAVVGWLSHHPRECKKGGGQAGHAGAVRPVG